MFLFWAKIWISDKNLNLWQKFEFVTKIWICDKNLNLWQNFEFFGKIRICDKNYNFSPKLPFLTTISIFRQNFELLFYFYYFTPRSGFFLFTFLGWNLKKFLKNQNLQKRGSGFPYNKVTQIKKPDFHFWPF